MNGDRSLLFVRTCTICLVWNLKNTTVYAVFHAEFENQIHFPRPWEKKNSEMSFQFEVKINKKRHKMQVQTKFKCKVSAALVFLNWKISGYIVAAHYNY